MTKLKEYPQIPKIFEKVKSVDFLGIGPTFGSCFSASSYFQWLLHERLKSHRRTYRYKDRMVGGDSET